MNPALQPGLALPNLPEFATLQSHIAPDQISDFHAALVSASIARAQSFIDGLSLYRAHPSFHDFDAAPIIWQNGTTVLRDYAPDNPHAPTVLVIPSLINRVDILDLDPDFSFLRALAASGMRPLLVDWQAPGATEKNFSLHNYIYARLVPALRLASAQGPCAVLGYCMGGLLALALAALMSAHVSRLALLATPWDFQTPADMFHPQLRQISAQIEPLLTSHGELPVDALQALFMQAQPLQSLHKFSRFATLDQTSNAARHFVLTEDWLNDGIPLTAPTAREILNEWYGRNAPAQLQWHVGDTLIDPRLLKMPTSIIACGHDRIVPPASSFALAAHMPHAHVTEPAVGHIGLMVSKTAPQKIWTPLFDWLRQT